MSILSISQPTSPYPATNLERDKWVLERRPARETLDPQKPHWFFVEQELSASGAILPVATIFLTNRECPWRCVMCDLWRNTLTTSVPPGAIPAQIDFALSQLPAARVLKLYNSGSFFDSRAIPVEDHPAIAESANNFERLIVENHPALVNDLCLRFRDRLRCPMEIAMGLETVHPDILPRLNKRMTLEQFSSAAKFLRTHDIDLRVFILVQPPFMQPHEAVLWAQRSVDFAFDCGATAVTLIPTRGGNGAMEALAANTQFSPPRLEALEESFSYGLRLKRGRVFADLWDAERTPACPMCRSPRIARLRHMNLSQINLAPARCLSCDPAS
ncbi:MAG: archaeosine synthase beta-subunit [Acidobacteriaceae bacterium]|nr:archaeosine synthase beta-subunit [Acidobacteriaceae bacterium]